MSAITAPFIDFPAAPRTAPAQDASSAPLSIDATTRAVADAAIEKAGHPTSYFVRSLIGGVFVGFGVLLSLVVSNGVKTPGLSSLLMGLAFGGSLVLILASGTALSTADMAAGAFAVFQRRLSIPAYVRLVAVGLAGNIAGAAVFIVVVAAAGGPYLGSFAERAAAVASAKASQPIGTQILLAILCTWFLQTAMVLFFKARSEGAKNAFAFYGPLAFVAGGTQHIIANIGFLGLPLLLAAFHPGAPAANVTPDFGPSGLFTDLATTTLGNLIGGIVFVALPFHVVARLQERGR